MLPQIPLLRGACSPVISRGFISICSEYNVAAMPARSSRPLYQQSLAGFGPTLVSCSCSSGMGKTGQALLLANRYLPA